MTERKTRQRVDKNMPLAPHFVVYDYDDPPPAFTPEQVAVIELPGTYLNGDDLARLRTIETWVLNTNTGWLNSPEIPGLRPDTDRDHRYVRRYSDEGYERMMDRFLGYIRSEFMPRGLPCNMPGFRVTLPSGDKYYPIMFHDELEKWARVSSGPQKSFSPMRRTGPQLSSLGS